MKNKILILLAFSLVLILSFISNAQTKDSSSAQIKVESKFDSIIIKKIITIKLIDSLGRTYTIKKVNTMNGGENSNHNPHILYTFTSSDYTMNGNIISLKYLAKRLDLFKSSSLEYRKSKNKKAISIIGYVVSAFSIEGLLILGIIESMSNEWGGLNSRGINTANTLLYTCIPGLTIGLPIGIINRRKSRLHFQKSIELHNEEILKRLP
ncbi:MAG: hypothetical protein HY840_09555 [Bacteroidetes bacterium]|nr:hypothetical protein [Bacteroidota bacterium]